MISTSTRRAALAAVASALVGAAAAGDAMAGPTEVVDVTARKMQSEAGAGVWRFDVTLRHADTGWEHYADSWRVLGPDGEILGERILLHPHVEEQPFTRSLSPVRIPDAITTVTVVGHDNVDGWGAPVTYELPTQ